MPCRSRSGVSHGECLVSYGLFTVGWVADDRMHETFVYSSSSQLLQVTFWHAYRDFFTHPSTKEQLLSASEVIKNVTVAFPGASAKIWVDETGAQKFVIAGMGFRKGSGTSHCMLGMESR